jgi:transcriptional regulator with XRE-family HTH domain
MESDIMVLTIKSKKFKVTESGSRLRQIRVEQGLSRRHIAEQLGVTIAAVQDYERSEAAGRITLKTLRKYADVLGCDVTLSIAPRGGHPSGEPPTLAPTKSPRRRETPALPTKPQTVAEPPALQDRMGLWTAS